MASSETAESRIQVAVRIRPTNEAEKNHVQSVGKTDDTTVQVLLGDEHATAFNEGAQSFCFDQVFDDSDTQADVYEEGCLGIVDAALDGRFVTVFAYGQTGSGKTHTILGAPADSHGNPTHDTGLLLRVFHDLFRFQRQRSQASRVIIALSAVEIYLNDVFDLLGNRTKCAVREADGGRVSSATVAEVTTASDVLRLFAVATAARTVASTKMNDQSSRSHALFFIDVIQVPHTTHAETSLQALLLLASNHGAGIVRSRVTLVDLAGSERPKKSKVEGQAMTEAIAINKSLMTLGQVIHQLYQGAATVPFRESTLTKLLKPALIDATARLLLVGQVSPSDLNAGESLQTLQFCSRMKQLKAESAPVDEDISILEGMAKSRRTAAALSADLALWRAKEDIQGVVPAKRMYASEIPSRSQAVSFAADALTAALSVERARNERDLQSQRAAQAQEYQRRVVAEAVAKSQSLQKQLSETNGEVEQLEAELATTAADLQATTEKALTAAKRAKKRRVQAEEALQRLHRDLDQTGLELDAIRDYTAASLPANDDVITPAEEEEWQASEAEWATREGNNAIVDDFCRLWKPLAKHHRSFLKHCMSCTEAEAQLPQLEAEATKVGSSSRSAPDDDEVVSKFIPDAVAFCLERALEIAEGAVDPTERWYWYEATGARDRATVLSLHLWQPSIPMDGFVPPPKPLPTEVDVHHFTTFSDDDDDGAEPAKPQRTVGNHSTLVQPRTRPNSPVPPVGSTVVASSPPPPSSTGTSPPPDPASAGPPASAAAAEEMPMEITHAQAVRNAREKRKERGSSSIGKRLESDEANKHYLMTVYDSPTLVQDVSRFLSAGSLMIKHGRMGDPHRRKLWISSSTGVRKVVWVDPDSANQQRSEVLVSNINRIQLGPYTKVFKRHPIKPSDKSFYRCFSICTKDNSRTLDLVADTLVDFEAWVLGLSHLAQVDPIWGGNLALPPPNDPLHEDVSAKEANLCAKENVALSAYVGLRTRVQVHRDEIAHQMKIFNHDAGQAYKSTGGIHAPQVNHKGAVLMTKGELRYHSTQWEIDIFRICKLWQLFRELELIYDPSYLPATCFGTTTRK